MIFFQQNMRIEKFKKLKKSKARSKTSFINKFVTNFENNIFLLNKDSVLIYRCYIYKHKTFNDIVEYSISSKNLNFRRYFESIHRIKILTC